MATSIWDIATEGISSFDSYKPDIELSYEDRAAIDVATESDTGFVDYIDQCTMSLLDAQNMTFAQESVAAIQVAKGMDYDTAMEGLKNTLRNAWEALKNFLQKVWETIKEYVTKAKDWLARRASLGKAMLTKYSSVLRNKKVSANLEFDWCEVRIAKFVQLRASVLKNAFVCGQKGELDTLIDTVTKSKQEADDLLVTIQTRTADFQILNDTNAKKSIRKDAYNRLIRRNPQQMQDEIDADIKSGKYKGKKGGLFKKKPPISIDRLNEIGAKYAKIYGTELGKLLAELKKYQQAFSTQELSDEMNRTLYGNAKGPQHMKKKWSEIQNEVMQWADMDTGRYFTEALGIFEKDANSYNAIIKEFEKNSLDEIDETYKNATGNLKKLESAARTTVSRIVVGSSKLHKMYVTRLKEAISLMQTQAIAAARKAILDKGTTNESYTFNDMDVIY